MDQKTFWSAAAGLADPELRQLAQKIAEAIPANSPLRSVGVERLMGALKGWLEAKAKSFSPAAGLGVEKLTDFLDFLAGALKHESGTVEHSQAIDSVEKIKKLAGDILERLKKADEVLAPKIEAWRKSQKWIKKGR